jgi:hypothetical protein
MGQAKNTLLEREFNKAFEDENVLQFFREKDREAEEQMVEKSAGTYIGDGTVNRNIYL